MSGRTRTNYSPEEKVSILRKHLLEHVPISQICEEYKLQPTVFYRWQKQFFENGALAFISTTPRVSSSSEKRIKALEDKLQRKNEVVAELMEDHVRLKKEFGEL